MSIYHRRDIELNACDSIGSSSLSQPLTSSLGHGSFAQLPQRGSTTTTGPWPRCDNDDGDPLTTTTSRVLVSVDSTSRCPVQYPSALCYRLTGSAIPSELARARRIKSVQIKGVWFRHLSFASQDNAALTLSLPRPAQVSISWGNKFLTAPTCTKVLSWRHVTLQVPPIWHCVIDAAIIHGNVASARDGCGAHRPTTTSYKLRFQHPHCVSSKLLQYWADPRTRLLYPAIWYHPIAGPVAMAVQGQYDTDTLIVSTLLTNDLVEPFLFAKDLVSDHDDDDQEVFRKTWFTLPPPVSAADVCAWLSSSNTGHGLPPPLATSIGQEESKDRIEIKACHFEGSGVSEVTLLVNGQEFDFESAGQHLADVKWHSPWNEVLTPSFFARAPLRELPFATAEYTSFRQVGAGAYEGIASILQQLNRPFPETDDDDDDDGKWAMQFKMDEGSHRVALCQSKEDPDDDDDANEVEVQVVEQDFKMGMTRLKLCRPEDPRRPWIVGQTWRLASMSRRLAGTVPAEAAVVVVVVVLQVLRESQEVLVSKLLLPRVPQAKGLQGALLKCTNMTLPAVHLRFTSPLLSHFLGGGGRAVVAATSSSSSSLSRATTTGAPTRQGRHRSSCHQQHWLPFPSRTLPSTVLPPFVWFRLGDGRGGETDAVAIDFQHQQGSCRSANEEGPRIQWCKAETATATGAREWKPPHALTLEFGYPAQFDLAKVASPFPEHHVLMEFMVVQ